MADRVVFTSPDAARIANAVRKVEEGNRDESGLRFDRTLEDRARSVFRIATFSGAWPINGVKAVTLKYKTASPNTIVARNLFFPIDTPPAVTLDCAVAREGTSWFLVDVPLEIATTVSVDSVFDTVVLSGTADMQELTLMSTVDLTLKTFLDASGTATAITASVGPEVDVLTDITLAAELNTNNCAITVYHTADTQSISTLGETTEVLVLTNTSASTAYVFGAEPEMQTFLAYTSTPNQVTIKSIGSSSIKSFLKIKGL